MAAKKTDYVPPAQLPGRNDPCHCGSGKKYKKCHEDQDATATHAVLEKKWAEGEKEVAKRAEDEKEEAGKQPNAQNTSHRPASQPHAGGQKHNTMAAPKFNMPRKTGGGG